MAKNKKANEADKRETNVWDVVRWSLGRLFSAGYAVPIVFIAGAWILLKVALDGIDAAGRKELLRELVSNLHFGAMGWVLFFIALIIGAPALKWLSMTYEKEIERQRQIIDKLLPRPDDSLKLKSDT